MLAHPVLSKLKANADRLGHYVCVGLDPDIDKLPTSYDKTIKGLETFFTTVIEETVSHCIAYKPNISFFEAYGIEGLQVLERLLKRIPDTVPVILDAKRGDIGNTAAMQARYVYDYFGADATTINPYMGFDNLEPFFKYKDKLNFVLCLTSNKGAEDFELKKLESGKYLYEEVADRCSEWNTHGNIGLVVGATQDRLKSLRAQVPELPFLIPGVGSQGGSYSNVIENGAINNIGITIIPVSRSILYDNVSLSYEERIDLIK